MKWNFGRNGDNVAPKKIKNIYARGADDGFWLGLYLSALFGMTIVSLSAPLFNIITGAMALGVPVLTYFFLRRTHIAAHGMTVFSALWMQGITMFACGCLIFGTVSFIYLRWIDPDFLTRVLQLGVDYYSASDSESSQMLAAEFQMIIDSKVVPSALNVAFGWMWLGMFSGSVLSMFVAGFVKLRKVTR